MLNATVLARGSIVCSSHHMVLSAARASVCTGITVNQKERGALALAGCLDAPLTSFRPGENY